MPGEMIEDYHRRLIHLQDRCNADNHTRDGSHVGDEKVLEIFLNGIPLRIIEHMVVINPRTLDEALSWTKLIESRINKLGTPKLSTMVTQARITEEDDSDDELPYSMATISVNSHQESSNAGNKPAIQRNMAKTLPLPKNKIKGEQENKTHSEEKLSTELTSTLLPKTAKRIIRDTTTKVSTETGQRSGVRHKHLISLRVRGRILKCLLDPASDLSLISHTTIQELQLGHKVTRNTPLELISALRSTATLEESIDLLFTLEKGNNQFIHTFHLLKSREILGYNAIVGIDFLVANCASVDYKKLEVSMWGEVVAGLELLVGQPPAVEVIIARYLTEEECEIFYRNKRKEEQNGTVEQPPTVTENTPLHQNEFLTEVLNKTQIVGENKNKLKDICTQYSDAFIQRGPTLGTIKNYTHSVTLTDETPIKLAQYPVPVKLKEKFKTKLDEYEKSGIIERSNSPWNIPMFAKLKRNGDLRFVLDATAINNRTLKIDYPIFRIDETFNQLQGKTWFSSIDLRNGYHQINLDTKSRRYFAFRTPFGKYQYRRMPMGASNSGIFFQSVMESLLRDHIGKNLIVYQDDVLIATDTVSEHLKILETIFQLFARDNILIHNDKSRFVVREVNFLGHVLRDGTFSPSSDNLDALSMLSPPTTLKQLRSFIGKLNFYAKFFSGLSQIISPLTDLLSTGRGKFVWDPIHNEVFEQVKKMICSHPILHYPDYTQKFVISIQVSEMALIGVVEQGEGTELHPIGYYSKKLSRAQRNYNILEKNALAVISVLEHFHQIIIGYPVEIHSSRKTVEYLRGLKDGNTRVTDWMTKISKYSPEYVFNSQSKAITNILYLNSPSQTEDNNVDNTIPKPCDAKMTLDKENRTDLEEEMTHNTIKPETSDVDKLQILPTAYTDGSCTRNGTPQAGIGIGVHWENCTLTDYHGCPANCLTNNRAELLAIIHAMTTAVANGFERLKIVSDSMYAIDNITKHMPKWESHNWKSARNKQVENIEEFKTICRLQKIIEMKWEHTPGHADCKGNNIAHELAEKGRLRNTGTETDQYNTLPITVKPEILAIRTIGQTIPKIVTTEEITLAQRTDDHIIKLRKEGFVQNSEPAYGKGITLFQDSENIILAKGIINIAPKQDLRVRAIYVPEGLRTRILASIHENKWVNHAGYVTTCTRLLEQYFWNTFRHDTREYLRVCEVCQKNSPPRKKIQVMNFVKPDKPGQKIALDIIGPIVTSIEGHKYILTIIDMFTRYAIMCPLSNIRAEEVISCLERNYITIFGVPICIITDRGSNFRSEVFTQACRVLKIKHYMSAPYHPATNGMVERMNKEIKRKLTTLCHNAGRSWAAKLHLVQFAHNNSHHGSINTSPNSLTFGEDRNFPEWGHYEAHPTELGQPSEYIDNLRKNLSEIREIAWEFEEKIRNKRNKYTNKNRVIPRYNTGDMVLYRSVKLGKTRNQGFRYIYDGPFEIKECLSPVSYIIGIEGDSSKETTKRTHVERLRPFYKSTIIKDITEEKYPTDIVELTLPLEEVNAENIGGGEVDEKLNPNIPPPVNQGKVVHRLGNDTIENSNGDNTENKEIPQHARHNYNTRNKNNTVRKCYKHWDTEACQCHTQD